MAQDIEYKGTLGFEFRADGILDSGSATVVDTLEEYGHAVGGFGARAASRVTLDCDAYHVELRLRRLPLPVRGTPGAGPVCAAKLELRLKPHFPDQCEPDLAGMLLATLLKRLLQSLEAVTVQWMGSPAVLPREAFLAAFAPSGTAAAAPAGAANPRAVRGRDCFAPVEQTAAALEEHCDEILRQAHERASGRLSDQAVMRARARVRGAFARTRTPRAFAAWAAKLPLPAAAAVLRAGSLRFGFQVLAAATLFLYLDSAAAVRAAITQMP
ncbi:hypothetical protein ACUXV3_05950 [Roseobacteraceae bacterium NS-SX3]